MSEYEDKREDENSDEAPGTGVEDQVLVRGPHKLAHEDLAATQAEIDDENTETRAGEDFEGQPSAAQLNAEDDEDNEDE